MEINSEPVKAVVYQKGVFLTRHAKAVLHKGPNTVCIVNLSDSIVAETIQISMSRGLSCSQVVYDPDPEKEKSQNPEPDVSEEENELNKRRTGLQHQMEAAETNLEMLSVKEMLRDRKDLESSSLNDFLDFLEKKRVELADRISDCRDKIHEIDRQIKKLSEKEHPDLTGMIRMETEAEEDGEFSFEILYYDREARWVPFYDIQINSLSDPAEIMLKGRIIQNTGEIWDGIDLTLSTGNLQLSNNQPELKPWILRQFVASHPPMAQAKAMRPQPSFANTDETVLLSEPTVLKQRKDAGAPETSWAPAADNTYKKNQTSAEFHVAGEVRIESGGEGDIVQILSVKNEAEYIYYITPKAECSAFLMARIKRRDEYQFVEADANIFLENRYVGATHIEQEDEEDEYMISLGRDRDLYVERRQLKRQQTQSLMGNTVRKGFSYQMRIRNRKSERVHVLVKDQIPITIDEKIHVEAVDCSGADLDEKTGTLSWERDLAGEEEWTIDFAFRVSWPKNYPFTI